VIQFEVEFDGVLADIYDWADGEGDIPSFVPIPDEVAEMIEFYEELNGWLDSFRGAYETAKQGFEAASSGDPCLIFTFIEENADTIIDLIPDF
jgi:hypothetical protein